MALNNVKFERFFMQDEMRVYAGQRLSNRQPHSMYTLNDIVFNILNSKSVQDIHSQCVIICERYGFDFFTIVQRVYRTGHSPLFFRMIDHIDKFAIHYEKQSLLLDDPGIRIATQRVTPFVMSSDVSAYNLSSRELRVIHDALDFGLREVFYAPFGDQAGGYGLVRFVHNAEGRASVKERQKDFHVQGELFLLASYLHGALIQILKAGGSCQVLTEREKEILKWTAAGKSTARIGDLLLISENTVSNHLKNIRVKMGVSTTTHAVAKALVERIIFL